MCAIAGANVARLPRQRSLPAGQPEHIVAGMTFVVLFSDDGGTTWH